MLSDPLFEAIEEIEMYEKNYPDLYGGRWKDEIAEVKAVMRRLQRKLDAPPTPKKVKESEEKKAAEERKAKKSKTKKS